MLVLDFNNFGLLIYINQLCRDYSFGQLKLNVVALKKEEYGLPYTNEVSNMQWNMQEVDGLLFSVISMNN